ncbi:acyl-CoA dehydrogenase family protein [Pseudomonas sp. PCH199]|uniref:acyl-CoA dehydrogenase family protein n=1 Tax=unclassified Pseudomonas TaxID=196821 RepID=UPI000BC9AA2C|nr:MULTISPECIES: acyl-CoA dehydrogenase family protein [unclassified Pseudomonas]MCW8279207.1 acyl-CoA dehydrogenase family protein [Pseudomonas sp. PCH199]PAM78531.1 acyl-CoA dehydrogenase [Pseudomonas sp. ERMR1:02]
MLDNYRSPWLDDDVAPFADSVRRFVTANLAPMEEKWREAHQADRASWLAAGEMGMILPDVDVEYGGSGGTPAHLAVVVSELFYAGVSGMGVGINHIVGHYILADGTEAQKQCWLPKIASGEVICSVAMTEPGTGSDLQAVRTRAVKQGDRYIINGAKTFITNGQTSDMVAVVAKTDQAAGSKGISIFLVDTRLPGFRRGKCLDKIGLQSSDTSEMYFDDVEVSADCLLGEVEGQGLYTLMKQLPFERAQIAIGAVATMERALALTLEYTKERKVFGKPILDFQNTRFTLADIKATVVASRTFCDHIIAQWINGKLDSTLASMGKFWLTERQSEVLDQCLQFFGGYGYMNEYPIARMWADARVARIYGGANEIQRELVGRSL